MPDIRDVMRLVDERIFRSPIVRAVMTIGTHPIEGAFFDQPRELTMPEGGIGAIAISFECQYDPAIAELAEHDHVSVEGYGAFRFLRELLPGGDESGLTIIELGTVK